MSCLHEGFDKNSSALLLFIFSILEAAYASNYRHTYFKFKILPFPGFRSSADLGLRHFSKFNLLRGHLDDIFNNWVKSLIWTDVSLFCSLYMQITQRMCLSRIFSLREILLTFSELPEWSEFFWSKRTGERQTFSCYFSMEWILLTPKAVI